MGRVILAALGGFISLNISGLWLGYAGLSSLLKDEKQFAELCEGGEDDCAEQKKALSLIYTCGSTALFASYIFHGIILDKFGPRITSLFSIFLVCSGQVLLAFADSESFNAFIPAAILIGFGGPGIHMAWFNFSNLFPKAKGSFNSYVVSCFASSGLIYVLYHILYKEGLARKFVILAHVCIQVCLSFLVIIYYPKETFKVGDSITFTSVFHYSIKRNLGCQVDYETSLLEGTTTSKFVIMNQCRFIFLLMFFSVHLLRFNFYLSSALTQLESKGDDNHDYLFILSIVLPCGFVFIPLVGYIIDKGGIACGWASVQIFGIIFGACILVDNLPLQIVGFLAYSAFRIALFTCMNTAVMLDYGIKHFGVLSGTVCFVGSVLSLLQYVATLIAEDFLNEDYFWCDVFMVVILAPLLLYNIYTFRVHKENL